MKKENLLSKKQKDVLKKLIKLFKKNNIRYAISGGLASIIYGVSNRKLFDVDVLTDGRGLKKVEKLLKGYKVKGEALKKRQDLKRFAVNFMALDIEGILVDMAEDKNAFAISKGKKFRIPVKLEDAKQVIFAGIKLKVRPPEELIIQRLLTSRVIDKKDVMAIMNSNKIDLKYLEKRAREVEIWDKIKNIANKKENRIKLIIIDFYGVMTKGSYRNTCRWLAKKYKLDFSYLYDIVYHKYFSQATLGKISEKQSFSLPLKELGLKETWQELRRKHLSFQALNKSVFNLCLKLQKQGYMILLLSKNTPGQFALNIKQMKIRKYFKNIINTFDLKLPKSSVKTIKYVLKKYKVKPTEVIMTDDQDFNLVEPKRLGIKVILYRNFKDLKRKLVKYL